MALEERREEDDVETPDEDDDPSPPTPPPLPIRRLSTDMKEHQFRQRLELEKRNMHRNPADCVWLTRNLKTPDRSATHAKSPCIKEITSRGTTPERNTNTFD
jgi:hypothetical protein